MLSHFIKYIINLYISLAKLPKHPRFCSIHHSHHPQPHWHTQGPFILKLPSFSTTWRSYVEENLYCCRSPDTSLCHMSLFLSSQTIAHAHVTCIGNTVNHCLGGVAVSVKQLRKLYSAYPQPTLRVRQTPSPPSPDETIYPTPLGTPLQKCLGGSGPTTTPMSI